MDHRVRFSRANAAVQLPVDEMAFRAAFFIRKFNERKNNFKNAHHLPLTIVDHYSRSFVF